MDRKICVTCGLEKDKNEFRFVFDKQKQKDYWRNSCKECEKQARHFYKEQNPEKVRETDAKSYRKRKDKKSLTDKKRYWNDPEKARTKTRNWRINNPDKVKEYRQKYYIENKDTIIEGGRERRNNYAKQRRLTDPTFKMREFVSKSIWRELEKNGGNKNGQSVMDFLSYTIEDFMSHLQHQFEPWMTWSNHGKYNKKTWNDNDQETWKWQIDHIIPHSTFHYTSMDCQEFRECWALSNLRPLNAKQNVLDGVNKIRHLKDNS
jgi:hypothetical protein